jgi:hypothetical protein
MSQLFSFLKANLTVGLFILASGFWLAEVRNKQALITRVR